MLWLTAFWALAEGSLFFLVADIPISWIGIRQGTRPALAAALIAAPLAALGGLGVALATRADPAVIHHLLVALPGIGEPLLASAVRDWSEGGLRAMLDGSVGGVPYKLYAHAAGLDATPPAAFLVLSVVARLPRFLAVAVLSGGLGRPLGRVLSGRAVAMLFAAFWTVFYCFYFLHMAKY